jgi:hypothetical protein
LQILGVRFAIRIRSRPSTDETLPEDVVVAENGISLGSS